MRKLYYTEQRCRLLKGLFGKTSMHSPSVLVVIAPSKGIISLFATDADNASAGEDTTKQLSAMQAKIKKQAAYSKVSCLFLSLSFQYIKHLI